MIEVRELTMLVTFRNTGLLEEAHGAEANLAIAVSRLFNATATFILHADHFETCSSADGADLRQGVWEGLIDGVHIGTLDDAAWPRNSNTMLSCG
jgi:hypothetical protein